jgi:hypothetical protein
MKRITVLSMTWILALSFAAAFAGEEEPRTFRGEISDSQCAFNVHSLTQSHAEMLKSKSGAAGQSPVSCSQYCIDHLGGKFVLATKSRVYHLDNQVLPRGFVGKKVKVRGILDSKTEIIQVVKIEAE